MITLVKTVRAIIWTVVVILTTTMAGVCLYAGYKVVIDTNWESITEIGKTLGILFVLIIITFMAGGFVLWGISELVLPLSTDEQKGKSLNEK